MTNTVAYQKAVWVKKDPHYGAESSMYAEHYISERLVLNTFPKDICIDGLSTKQKFPKLYYSERLKEEYLEVAITVSLQDKKDVETMQQFWYSELNNMYEPFYIDLPLFGENHTYSAEIVLDLSASWKDSVFPKKERITIRILDDIEKTFNKNRFEATVKSTGGKLSFRIDAQCTVDWGNGILVQYGAGVITDTPFAEARITSLDNVQRFQIVSGDYVSEVNIVKALDLIWVDETVKDLPELTFFDINNAPNILSAISMAENTPKLKSYPINMNTDGLIYGSMMYKGSGIYMVDQNFENTETFNEMFMGALRLSCISRLNTLKKTDTTDMFTNTPKLVYPDAADKALIVNGYDWVNSVYCPFFVRTCIEPLIYDKTNIKKEFNILNNMTTDEQTLKVTSFNGDGTSDPLKPTVEFKKFTDLRDGICKPFKARYVFTNISDGSVADTLNTTTPIANGDNLVWMKDDGSIVKFIASGVTGSYAMDTTAITAGEIPKEVYLVDTALSFKAGNIWNDATVKSNDYKLGHVYSETDPFGDGSMIAKYKLTTDGADLLGNWDGVATDVVFALDTARGVKVGDFRASLSKIQTQFKTSSIGATYTMVFWAKRISAREYDDPYTEKGSYGAHWMFDGTDTHLGDGDCNSGAAHKGASGGLKRHLCDYGNMTEWNMYSYGRTNGKTNSLHMNTKRVAEGDVGFSSKVSSSPFQIGSAGVYKSDNFNGYMSDFMIFNRELTTDEIISLYNQDAAKKVLVCNRTYNDLELHASGVELETKVEMKNEGDFMEQLTADLFGNTHVVNCFEPLAALTNPDWYGHDKGQVTVGNMNPEIMQSGQPAYTAAFNSATGEFIVHIGVNGDEKLTGDKSNEIAFKTDYGIVPLYWDALKHRYLGANKVLSNELLAYVDGKVCFEITTNVTNADVLIYDYETEV